MAEYAIPAAIAIIGGVIGARLSARAPAAENPELNITTIGEDNHIRLIFGSGRVPGSLVWHGNKQVRRESSGSSKGGGTEETVITISYDIIIADARHTTFELLQIRENNRTVYDASTPLSNELQPGSDFVFYSGADNLVDQPPDPHVESIEGVGEVPAYLNLCHIVFRNRDISGYRAIPRYEFVISEVGSTTTLERTLLRPREVSSHYLLGRNPLRNERNADGTPHVRNSFTLTENNLTIPGSPLTLDADTIFQEINTAIGVESFLLGWQDNGSGTANYGVPWFEKNEIPDDFSYRRRVFLHFTIVRPIIYRKTLAELLPLLPFFDEGSGSAANQFCYIRVPSGGSVPAGFDLAQGIPFKFNRTFNYVCNTTSPNLEFFPTAEAAGNAGISFILGQQAPGIIEIGPRTWFSGPTTDPNLDSNQTIGTFQSTFRNTGTMSDFDVFAGVQFRPENAYRITNLIAQIDRLALNTCQISCPRADGRTPVDEIVMPNDDTKCLDPETGDIEFNVSYTPSVGVGQTVRMLRLPNLSPLTPRRGVGPVLLSTDPDYNSASFWNNEAAKAGISGSFNVGVTFPFETTDFCLNEFSQEIPIVQNTLLSTVLSVLYGLTNLPTSRLDVTEGSSVLVRGFQTDEVTEVKEIIDQLRVVYHFDIPEVDGELRAVLRGNSSTLSLTQDDLIGDSVITETVTQQLEIPNSINFKHINLENDYFPKIERAVRDSTDSTDLIEISTSAVLNSNEAAQSALTTLSIAQFEAMGEKSFTTLSRHSKIIPSDLITFTLDNGTAFDIRLSEVNLTSNNELEVKGFLDNSDIYSNNAAGSLSELPPQIDTPFIRKPTNVVLADLPLLRNTDDFPGIYTFVQALPNSRWTGVIINRSLDGGTTFEGIYTHNVQTAIASTATALPDADPLIGDFTSTVDIVSTIPIVAQTQSQFDNWQSLLLIGEELVAWRDVVQTAPNVYRVSHFTRGIRQTPSINHDDNERVVLITPSTYLYEPDNIVNRNVNLFYSSTTFGLTDGTGEVFEFNNSFKSVTEFKSILTGISYNASNNLEITISGVGRIGAGIQVSHASSFKEYELVILKNAVEVRSIISNEESFIYTEAMQLEDFDNTLPDVFIIVIYQTNTHTGRGNPLNITFSPLTGVVIE